MGSLALLYVGLASAGYSAYSAHETKQEQEAALEQQREIQKEDLQDKKRKILAQQTASFAASGISLTSGIVDVTLEDTKVASQKEANRISNYYDTQMSNVGSQARASYINSLGSAVSSVGSYYTAGVN